MTSHNGFKIPIFQKDTNDAKEHLFILENDWDRQKVADDKIQIYEFTSTLQNEILQWLMKFRTVGFGQQDKTWQEIRTAFFEEYHFPEDRMESVS